MVALLPFAVRAGRTRSRAMLHPIKSCSSKHSPAAPGIVMFPSTAANKQLRSFWMSSSQRLQQRLPIWSAPLSVSRALFSQALPALQMLLIESPGPPALKSSNENQENRGAQAMCQETREFAGCGSASSASHKLTELPIFYCCP